MTRSRQEAAAVTAAYDFGPFRRLVDVGGGYGILLSAILAATPALRGVLFDRPEVVERARERLAVEAVLARCDVGRGRLLHGGAGRRRCLHAVARHPRLGRWTRPGIRIPTRCRAAMPDDATLLLVEAVLPGRAREQPGAVRMDLHMLTLLHGRERTVDEFRTVLAAPGLELRRVVPALPTAGLCVLEAAPGAAR